jgi:transcriptional regulator with XRE-family HTH domain
MNKTKSASVPAWVQNLRTLMEERGFNPRSLSLRAGLNATAVRDMIEGRSRFPRYDTAQALAAALDTTPALLMSDSAISKEISHKGKDFAEDMELLTEIIARLQEVADEQAKKLTPRDFAAMAATIYRRMQDGEESKKKLSTIRPQVIDLMEFETLRQKKAKR